MITRRILLSGATSFSVGLRFRQLRFSNDAKQSSPKENAPNHEDSALLVDEKEDESHITSNEKILGEVVTISDNLRVLKESRSADETIFMFPGQGIIKVGQVEQYMHCPAAVELFERAHEILGYDILKICQNGPQKRLNKTRHNQPATVLISLAALEVLKLTDISAFKRCTAAVGYSVGEITSLIFSGALTFEDGMRFIKSRATGMHSASLKSPQGMCLVHLKDTTELGRACSDAIAWASSLGIYQPVCNIAAYLYTKTKVIAGHEEALKYLIQQAEKYDFRKLSRIPVSGAFHTSLMESALHPISAMLNKIETAEPRCRVYSNYTAKPYRRQIKQLMLKQITNPVKWEQCIQNVYQPYQKSELPTIYDIASFGTMGSILRHINAKAESKLIKI